MTKKKKEYSLIGGDEYEESELGVGLGNPILNNLIGGQIPVGRMVELFGPWATGKSVLAWTILREAQKAGAFTLLIESEAAFSKKFATACGLDLKKLKMLVPTKEQALTVPTFFSVTENEMRKSQRHYPFSVIAVDSVAALNTSAVEKDGLESYDKVYMATLARQLSQGLNRLKGLLRPWNAVLIMVNQTRDNPGVLFGNSETTPGGKALKFYADLRIRLSNDKKEKNGKGMTANFYVAKSKLAPPFGRARFRIRWDLGLDPKYGKEEEDESSTE